MEQLPHSGFDVAGSTQASSMVGDIYICIHVCGCACLPALQHALS